MTQSRTLALAQSLSNLVFPVIRGIQAGREYYVAMWSLRMLRQISIFDEKELPPELRAQRVLNKARIPEISGYILDNPNDYVFSALTASIDSQVRFEPISDDPRQDRLGRMGRGRLLGCRPLGYPLSEGCGLVRSARQKRCRAPGEQPW